MSFKDKVNSVLDNFRRLQDGWDSYNAASISDLAIDKAMEVVTALPDDIFPPTAVPTSDGGLQLEWSVNTAYVVVSFDELGDRTIYFDHKELGEHEYIEEGVCTLHGEIMDLDDLTDELMRKLRRS
jgi:hypothetical protein